MSLSKPGGEINADVYFQAAQDHANSLVRLYEDKQYVLTVYVAGLAAECLIRAFRARKGLPFRSDHPLIDLAREGGFPELVPSVHRAAFDAALSNLILHWRNNHRFRSNAALKRFFKDLKLDRHIKGDYLKENARLLSSNVLELAGLGVMKWR